MTLFGWIDASILYCAVVVLMVIGKLRSVTKKIDDAFNSIPTSQLSSYPTLLNKTVISSVVRRVMWYPVVPLIAQFCNSFVETYAYVNRVVYFPLFLLCYIGMSLQGLLNALVFSQDIAVTRAFQAVKLHWWIYNVNSYESAYPHLSHNKAIIDEFSMPGKSCSLVELKTLNCNKTNIIKNDLFNDDNINDDFINDDFINDNIINNDNNNNNFNNSNNGIINDNNVNNNLVSQPSLLEWLRYMLLIKIFSAPKSQSRLISLELLSPGTSFLGNKLTSSFFEKDNSKDNSDKPDINIDHQNDDQDLHLVHPEPVHLKDSFQYPPLDLLSHCLNSSTSSDPLIGSSRSNQTNINAEVFEEIETFKLILKRL
ncbi:450_t:CDS:2 [Cetraspora pellucida]|uniref:450_t:CDS:1 n=1 Tax=Cetraspora pellucida TaxID=1433469 RepID=A0A9N9D1J1_9GLOM|nr:450_t:CDS:2 [Cetraspora pellucida]